MKQKQFQKRHWLGFLLTFFSFSIFAQTGKISGKVTDAKGDALAGSSVVIKGINKGTSADKSGAFSIANVANGSYNLVVTSVGYIKKEVAVTVPQSGNLNISLEEDANGLEEGCISVFR